MSSVTVAAGSGRLRPAFACLALLAALMVAVRLSRTRAEPRADHDSTDQHRGLDYEDHVLAPQRLPHSAHVRGGHITAHPVIYVPRVEVPARFYGAPGGYDGALVPQTARRPWHSVWAEGAARIPDAIETRPDGQTLYELKCPSPWLTFSAATPWARKMQTAFASQATAFFAWADQAPNRSVAYGFCGWVPPWAAAILNDLQTHFRQPIQVRAVFFAADFAPARTLIGAGAREALQAHTLALLDQLAPEELVGAAYDHMKD